MGEVFDAVDEVAGVVGVAGAGDGLMDAADGVNDAVDALIGGEVEHGFEGVCGGLELTAGHAGNGEVGV